jgi:hypothetical protein
LRLCNALAILLQHAAVTEGGSVKQIVVAFAIVGILVIDFAVYAESAIGLAVWPRVAYARANAQLRVQVERNDANRMLTWEIDGPSYYRSSTIQLDGASSPRNWFFRAENLPEGDFVVRATVRRNNNSESIAQATISVKPGLR